MSISSQQIEFDGRNADLVAAFDLTQRLEIERQLHEQAKAGNAVLDAAADGSWLLGSDGQIQDVNATYCRMSGYGGERHFVSARYSEEWLAWRVLQRCKFVGQPCTGGTRALTQNMCACCTAVLAVLATRRFRGFLRASRDVPGDRNSLLNSNRLSRCSRRRFLLVNEM